MLHIISCVLPGSRTNAEVPVQHIRSPSSADLGTKTLCGTARSTRDTARPGETQTETWEDSGQLQGYNKIHAHKTKLKWKKQKKALLTTLLLSFQASLKEAELRLADIRKAKKEFERRLLKPMKENRLEVKEPERVLQYIRDKSMVNTEFSLVQRCPDFFPLG